MYNITIITVCYNEENKIENTIQSVLMQTYKEFEYLIIDGKSSDGTIGIAEYYLDNFLELGIQYKIYSEEDAGIYNAMNKGIQVANGKWILFLNSGDCLADADILLKIVRIIRHRSCDIIYGDTIVKKKNFYKLFKGKEFSSTTRSMPFCHQSVFTRAELLKENGYNEAYKICSDFEYYLKCYEEHREFYYYDGVISIFSDGGISSNETCEELIELELSNIWVNHNLMTEREAIEYMKMAKFIRFLSRIKGKLINILPFFMKKMYELYSYKKGGWDTDINKSERVK